MRGQLRISVVTILALASSVCSAVPLVFEFSGAGRTKENDLNLPLPMLPGDHGFTGTFRYETDASLYDFINVASANYVTYNDRVPTTGIVGITVNIAGTHFASGPAGEYQVQVGDGLSGQEDVFSIVADDVAGMFHSSEGMQVLFTDQTQTVFSSTNLPTSLRRSDFDTGDSFVGFVLFAQDVDLQLESRFSGYIGSLRPLNLSIPEPSSLRVWAALLSLTWLAYQRARIRNRR